jgi:hypothetical protein
VSSSIGNVATTPLPFSIASCCGATSLPNSVVSCCVATQFSSLLLLITLPKAAVALVARFFGVRLFALGLVAFFFGAFFCFGSFVAAVFLDA